MKVCLKVIVVTMLITGPLYGQDQNDQILWTANWSSDGKYIAVGGVDKKIRIYDGSTFMLIKVYENGTAIQRMAWHPSSALLAVAALEDGSKIIDLSTDSIFLLNDDNGYGSRAMSWNYNGDLLANADLEGEITLWTKHGKQIRTIRKENTVSNSAIDWHPTTDTFVVLSDFVRIYNSNGKLIRKFKHRQENVLMLCVKWHPSGNFFVIGDYGDYDYHYPPLLHYRLADGKLFEALLGSKAEYRNVSWNKKGDRLATASDALRIWDIDGNLLVEGPSEDKLWGVDWSADGNYIITSSHLGHIKVWDSQATFIRELEK